MIDAASYGRALFQLAEEDGCGDGVLEELQLVRRALRENPGYVTLMDTPAVAGPEKHALLLQAFSGASQELRNFLCLLAAPARARLPDRGAAYDEAHGILRATAITAVPMQQQQRRPCAPGSSRDKTVSLTCRTDPTLLGGITLRYGGIRLDDSIRSRLERLRRSLSQTVV
ncbi:MAG: ATP synthase F1 subunit delta [Oscillospiraceae bacterium]